MSLKAALEQAMAGQPLPAEALFELGNALQQQDSLAEAVLCYRQALALRPDSVLTHNNLAVALMAQGKLDDAVASFQQALIIAPDYAEAHNNLGVALKRQKRIDEAIACYQRAIALAPGYAKAMLNLGTAYLLKKDLVQALAWSRASLDIDPEQVEANQNIAAIMLETGHLDEAQQYRDRAYRRQALFIDSASNPVRTVLLLWAAGKGNVPVEFLFPAETTTRITWMMEYATEEQARSLPSYDLVFNAIGDQDVTGPTAGPVTRFLRTCDKPVLNLPSAVAHTSRDRIPALLAPIDQVLVPSTLRLDPKEIKEQLLTLPGVRLPVLLRPSGSHGGDHLIKLESADDLPGLVLWNTGHYYATNFHDFRSSDGHYRKYRMVFIDRLPYPYHLAIGNDWLVHYETAGMLAESWKRAEEARFLEDPAGAIGVTAMAAVEAIGRRLDLDYCGVDFSVLPDGRVLVFEANATMLIHPEQEHEVLRYKNPYVQRILDAFEALLQRLVQPGP